MCWCFHLWPQWSQRIWSYAIPPSLSGRSQCVPDIIMLQRIESTPGRCWSYKFRDSGPQAFGHAFQFERDPWAAPKPGAAAGLRGCRRRRGPVLARGFGPFGP